MQPTEVAKEAESTLDPLPFVRAHGPRQNQVKARVAVVRCFQS